ncbi:MAG: sugar transferase [Chloroflexi bacterium]|nr:sugar transferase [Chloroflexota bacterium]
MMKRAFDFVVSLLIIFIALPLWLIAAIAIRLDSPGPVFYRGQRVGKDGKLFAIYKFRTMVADASNQGPGITRDADPRITRVGRFLRRLKIDKMPQLINVLQGEMSIVGPLCAGVRRCWGAEEIHLRSHAPLLPCTRWPAPPSSSTATRKSSWPAGVTMWSTSTWPRCCPTNCAWTWSTSSSSRSSATWPS